MRERCFNYKFILNVIELLIAWFFALLFLIAGILNSISGFLLLGMLFFIASVIVTIVHIYTLPIYYLINEDEIITVCLFKKYRFKRWEIFMITILYDERHLFIYGKDYSIHAILHDEKPRKTSWKYSYVSRVSKTRRTKRLIEKYYSSKLKE